jgi:hypothetical protein
MKESRVSKKEKRLDIRAVSEKVNKHGHLKRNEIRASKCDFLIGLNLDSVLSSSCNTADDHDMFCSAFLEEKNTRKTGAAKGRLDSPHKSPSCT